MKKILVVALLALLALSLDAQRVKLDGRVKVTGRFKPHASEPPPPPGGMSIELTLSEWASVARTDEPVSWGVPLKRSDNMLSLSDMRLWDGSAEVPVQMKVLSRFQGTPSDGTAPIRIVLLNFQATVAADGSDTLFLQDIATGLSPGSDLCTAGTPITVSTGVMTGEISTTAFRGFQNVSVGGTIVGSTARDGIQVVKAGTTYYSDQVAPDSVVIEENGDLRCVIRAKGDYADSSNNRIIPAVGSGGTPDPMTYDVSLHFYQNKSYVRVVYTHRNDNKGFETDPAFEIANDNFTSILWSTTLAPAGTYTVSYDGEQNSPVGTDNWHFNNTHTNNQRAEDTPTDNFSTNICKNAACGRGTPPNRPDVGWVDLSHSADGGVFVLTDWFWQQWPKRIEVTDTVIDYYLWDDEKSCPEISGSSLKRSNCSSATPARHHRIIGGAWKTHTMLYYYHSGTVDSSTNPFPAIRAALTNRLIPIPDPTHWAAAKPLGVGFDPSITRSVTWKGSMTLTQAIADTVNWYEVMYDGTGVDGDTIQTQREERALDIVDGAFSEAADMYGWENFGDFPRSTLEYNSNGLSHALGMCHAFLATGDKEFWEECQIMALHQLDMDFIHDPAATDADGMRAQNRWHSHGGQRYESDAHQDVGYSNSSVTWKETHNWASGLVMYYFMTGEPRFKEVAEMNQTHFERDLFDFKDCSNPLVIGEARQYSRAILNMVNVYRMNGDATLWTKIKQVITNCALFNEVGTNGWAFSSTANDTNMFYMAGVSEALVQAYDELVENGDASDAIAVKNYLIRITDWLIGLPAGSNNGPFTSWPNGDNGTYSAALYMPYCGSFVWNLGDDFTGTGNYYYAFWQANVFAKRYEITGEKLYLDIARKVHRDTLLYSQPKVDCGDFVTVQTSATPSHHQFDTWIKTWPIYVAGPMIYLNIESRLGHLVACQVDCL